MALTQPKNSGVVVSIRGRDAADQQLPLLPLRVDATIPSPFGSADLKSFVQTLDGHIYALKSLQDGPYLPASEFLCYKLASACGLPVPYSALIEETVKGPIGFGSRFEGGVMDPATLNTADQLDMFRESKGPVSAILALDCFVGNDDRHRRNFIFRKNFQLRWVPLAIDYSRAFLVRGFPEDIFPLPPSSNTQRTIDILKKSDMWDGPYAVFALESLASVTSAHLKHWFDEMPEEWLSINGRKKLIAWWESQQFSARLQKVLQVI
ncbi:MAG: hypothetical protein V4454_03385 [Pseudomonadota bacterium]